MIASEKLKLPTERLQSEKKRHKRKKCEQNKTFKQTSQTQQYKILIKKKLFVVDVEMLDLSFSTHKNHNPIHLCYLRITCIRLIICQNTVHISPFWL